MGAVTHEAITVGGPVGDAGEASTGYFLVPSSRGFSENLKNVLTC